MISSVYDWAQRYDINKAAFKELLQLLDPEPRPAQIPGLTSEAAAQQACRLAATAHGARLWRNNVGAGKLEGGSFIRWGLCNESSVMNAKIKSSDLIGVQPVLIQAEHVGAVVGRFVAREIKRPGWKYTGTDREEAQLRFIELVNAMGGDAAFSTGGF